MQKKATGFPAQNPEKRAFSVCRIWTKSVDGFLWYRGFCDKIRTDGKT